MTTNTSTELTTIFTTEKQSDIEIFLQLKEWIDANNYTLDQVMNVLEKYKK